jgi:hypothetical protein
MKVALFVVLLIQCVAYYQLFSHPNNDTASHYWLGVYCILTFLFMCGMGFYTIWKKYWYGPPSVEYSVLRSSAYIQDGHHVQVKRCRPPTLQYIMEHERLIMTWLLLIIGVDAAIGICFGFYNEDYITVGIACAIASMVFHLTIIIT